MGDRSHNLLFLLSMAPIAAGCPGDDSSSTSSSADSTTSGGDSTTSGSPMTTNTTLDETTGGPPGTTTGPMGTTTGPMGTDSSGGSDSGGSGGSGGSTTGGTTDSGSDGGSTTGMMASPCAAYSTQVAYCFYMGDAMFQMMLETACDMAVVDYAMNYGAMCEQAMIDALVCLSTLDCMEFPNIGMGSACDAEVTAFQTECA